MKWPTISYLLVIPLAAGALAAAVRAADPPAGDDRTDPAAIRQQEPAFFVRAEVNHPTGQYLEGDYVEVRVATEEDAFVYVLYKQADGQVFGIFPNILQPDNRVTARQAVSIPASRDQFRWKVGAPYGQEMIKVIATKEPLKNLDVARFRQQKFTPVSKSDVKGVAMELDGDKPSQWAEADVTIGTHPREWTPDGRPKRRVGVFFGVANYKFNAEEESAGGHLNLGVCHEDAKQLAGILAEVGELSERRIYTNELATKKNLEYAITDWLPKVSRPGDTVFIYFSGHGGQIPDDDGDEADGKDEILLPHDFLSLTAVAGMKKLGDARQLSAEDKPILQAVLGLIQRLGSIEKAAEVLARTTGVSDDLFGRWVQKLDGRQVILVLDICHAGGFAQGAKGIDKVGGPPAFDFLDQELGRLKDIGQGDTCLLAACGAQDTSQVRQEKDLSVLTYFLLQSIRDEGHPLTIERAHNDCETSMRRYFEDWNQRRQAAGTEPLPAHRPQLNNFSREPVVLKP